MLTTVSPLQFRRATNSGRTKACFVLCERPNGSEVEVVAKFSEGCNGVVGLAIEVIAGCLAGDLRLPIPEPYLVRLDPQWVEAVADPDQRSQIERSSPIAFGSTVLTPGFTVWSRKDKISAEIMPDARAVFVFDSIINNFDRRDENPNCLVMGNEIRIIDHDLAFRVKNILGWQEPWKVGALKAFETPGQHIFRAGLKGNRRDYGPVARAWKGLSDARVAEYERSIPSEWGDAKGAVDEALKLIRGARDRIADCLKEVDRVLT